MPETHILNVLLMSRYVFKEFWKTVPFGEKGGHGAHVISFEVVFSIHIPKNLKLNVLLLYYF